MRTVRLRSELSESPTWRAASEAMGNAFAPVAAAGKATAEYVGACVGARCWGRGVRCCTAPSDATALVVDTCAGDTCARAGSAIESGVTPVANSVMDITIVRVA